MEWWRNEFYSQFGEDALVFSYFRNRGYAVAGNMEYLEPGFFVDVGAHHPFMLSNTWFFYQRGWRGINIEPTPGVKEDFDAIRPEDTNLELAVSAKSGAAEFFTYGRAVANTMDPGNVDMNLNPERITVRTSPLVEILDKHLPQGTEVSYLSVDVEGLDLEVLESNDWSRYRPLVVSVESHIYEIDKIIESEIYSFMTRQHYKLYGWTPPTLTFIRG